MAEARDHREHDAWPTPAGGRGRAERLRAWAWGLSIDDFGTGHSSLAYLKRLPVDEIKIDRSFVLNMSETRASVIVRSTIDLGRNLGLESSPKVSRRRA